MTSLGRLVLFALLNGGDYDPTGIHGCGPVTALALCQCGYGDELVEATRAYLIEKDDEIGFGHFIQGWRNRLCDELRNNHHQYLTSRRPDLAHTVELSDFPKRDVMMAYISPLTTEHEPSTVSGARFGSWYLFHEPSLLSIAQFGRTSLLWSQDKFQERLVKRVFPSIVLRMLYSVSCFALSLNPY